MDETWWILKHAKCVLNSEFVDWTMDNRLMDMILDVGVQSFVKVDTYENISPMQRLYYIPIQLNSHDYW